MRVVWTDNALERLAEIEDFIARDDPDAAVRVVERIIERSRDLGRFPRRGREVPELGLESVRELLEGNYRIVYRIAARKVEILTVFEGHMLLPGEELPPADR